MNLNLRVWMVAMVSAMALLLSGEARAQSCTTFLQDRVEWMAQGGAYYLDIKGTSLNASQSAGNGVVSYVQGRLENYALGYYHIDPVTGIWVFFPETIYGDGITQTFSDRFTGSQPFNINAPESLGIIIDASGKIFITLQSLGTGTLTINSTSCMNDVIFGTSDDGTHWSFALYKRFIEG
jgi:hypothetical protein